MQHIELLIIIGIVALALGCYWAWRFYHKDDKPVVQCQPLFSRPTIKDGGDTYNTDGSINWDSDKPPRSVGGRMAMAREAFGEKHQCPACGSRRWGVAGINKDGIDLKDMIYCHDCKVVATDDPALRKQAEDEGMHVYIIADFDLRTA